MRIFATLGSVLVVLALLTMGVWFSRHQATIPSPPFAFMTRACATILSAADVVRACPNAAARRGLDVRADAVAFSGLMKCGISVIAPGAYTLYIAADVFPDAGTAAARFQARTEDVMKNSYYAVAPHNLTDLGEMYVAYLNPFGGRELNFQRGRVYVEIAPSGGDLCRGEDLPNLGRLLYGRVAQLVPSTE